MNEDQLNEQTDQEEVKSAREARRQELIRMFNPIKMKVIRKELFPSPRDPAVTFKSQAQFYGSRKLNCLHQTYTRASSCKFMQVSAHLVESILLRWCFHFESVYRSFQAFSAVEKLADLKHGANR